MHVVSVKHTIDGKLIKVRASKRTPAKIHVLGSHWLMHVPTRTDALSRTFVDPLPILQPVHTAPSITTNTTSTNQTRQTRPHTQYRQNHLHYLTTSSKTDIMREIVRFHGP